MQNLIYCTEHQEGKVFMKILIFIVLIIFSTSISYAYRLIHPLKFNGTESEKKIVIEYIVENVKKTYTAIGMDDSTTLRMMEKEELKNFKALTRAKNRGMLDRVIQTYCSIGMCDYSTIKMMYDQEMKSAGEELNW
jgi:hypothetical protein